MSLTTRVAARGSLSLTMLTTGLAFLALTACEGSEVRRLFTTDGATSEDTDADGTDGDVTGGGSLDFQVITATGPRGLGEERVVLVPADELADYAEVPGFQIDLEVQTTGVPDGSDVKLFVDDLLVAPGTITADSSLAGGATFRGVTIPVAVDGVTVRFETDDGQGNLVVGAKNVKLDIGACKLTVTFGGDADNTCVPPEVVDGKVGVTVHAQRDEGICDTLQVRWDLDGDISFGGILPDTTFDESGAADVFIELGQEGEVITGTLTVHATAVHPSDENGNASVDVSTALDPIAPTVAIVSPDPAVGVVGGADDAAPDIDGVQVAVTASVDETSDLELALDGVPVQTLEAVEPGEATFEAVTFTDGVVVTVTAFDACGNQAAAEATYTVVVAGSIAIATPTDGDKLLAVDDADPDTADTFETTVTVVAPTVDSGATIRVACRPANVDETVDYATVGQLAVSEPSVDGRYDVSVVLAAPNLGDVSCIADLDAPAAVSEPVAFTVAFPGPTLTLTTPHDAECFTSKTIPATGSTTGLVGRPVTYSISGGGVGSVAFVADDGTFDGTVDLPASAPDGDFTVSFDATDAWGNIVSATQGDAAVTIAVDTAVPVLALTAPTAATVGPTGDADTTTPGYQVAVTATLTDAHALGGRACLVVNSGTPACTDVAGTTVSFGQVTLAAGGNTLTLNGSDACGNPAAEVTRLVTLLIENPLVVLAPTDGTTLLAAADGDPVTARVYETEFRVRGSALVTGATLEVECRAQAGTTYTSVGALTVGAVSVDGVYAVPVGLDVDVLGTSVSCRAKADLPTASTSTEVALKIGLPAPTLAITAPAASACVTTRDIVVTGTSSALDGRTVTLTGATGTGVVGTAGAWSATGAVSADGPVTLGATATDAFGNPASAATVAFVVDATAPALALQAPPASIDPDVLVDEDPVTPGYQTTVRVAATDAHLVGGQACYAFGAGTPVCASLDATGVATFTGVTFQVGDNALTLSGRDGCGTSASAVPVTVALLDNGDLTVAITTPAADLFTAATSLAFTVSVSDADGPISGAAVTLAAGGVDTGVAAVDNGDGTYRFAGVAIPVGATTSFVASATRISRSGESAPRLVTNKSVAPTMAITAPADGAFLNLASAECQAGQVPCVTTVTGTTTDTEDGSQARLTVTCGTSVATATTTVTDNALSFAGVSLATGNVCTVAVTVTDAVGQSASASVDVTVDRVAPTVDIVAPGALLLRADDRSADPGIQSPLTVDLGGVEAGQIATAVLTWTEAGTPKTKSVTHTVATDTADGATYVAQFEETPGTGFITWPQGDVTVVVSVADLAGNAASDTQALQVDVTAGVRITAPTDTATTCSGTCAVGVCNDGACYRNWGLADQRFLVAVTSGLTTTTNNVRVCSDHASLATAPGAIACASTPSGTTGYYQVLLTSAVNGTSTLDLSSALPDGFQRLVVEAKALPSGDWGSSQSATAANERERRVFVDVSAPVVSGLGSPSDRNAPIGVLNKAEQKGGVTGAYDITFTASEAGRADVYVNGSVVSTQQVPAGATTLTLTLPQGDLQIWVVLRDAAGNTSPATPGQGALTYSVRVDYTPPTLAFLQPNKTVLNASDTRAISLSSDEEGASVLIAKIGVGLVGAPVVTSGVASLPTPNALQVLTEGTSSLYAYLFDAAGNLTVTDTLTVLVDLTPPTVSITSPANGAALTDANDADAAAGFQVSAGFTSGAGASSWTLSIANGCDSSYANCQAPVQVATATGSGAVTQLANVDLGGTTTYAKILVDVADDAGNHATAESRFSVTLSSCALAITGIPTGGWFNIANTCPGGTACATAPVTVGVAPVGLCPPISRIDLINNGSVVGSHNGSGAASFDLTIADGAHLVLEGKAYQGGSEVATTGTRTRDADFTAPAVSFVARTIGAFTTAAEGQSVTYSATNDVSPTAGLQFHASIDVADAHASGGQVTAATATAGTTVALTPSNITLPHAITGTTPIRVDLLDLTLNDGATYAVVVTAEDAAGNSDTATFSAAVDISAPPEVPITAVTITRRRPTVKVDFTNVASNAGGTSAVTAYEVRYSASPIDATNFSSACLSTAGELLGSSAAPTPGTPGTPNTVTIGGPDTRPYADPCKLDIPGEVAGAADSIWQYVAIRGRDAAGNWSPLGASSVHAIANKDVWLDTDAITIDNTNGSWGSTSTAFLTLRGGLIGDIDGGGRPDVIFGSSTAQAFCVVRGEALGAGDLVLTSPTGTNHTCLLGTQVGSLFTGATNTGHHVDGAGDFNGDGVPDFAVSGRITAATGYVAVYFGRAGSLPDLTKPNIKIRGMASGGSYNSWCNAGDFDGVGQTSGATTVFPTELAVGQSSGATNLLWVIKGQASWTTATEITIDVSVANDLVYTFNFTKTTASPAFGNRCAAVGDLLPNASGTGVKGELAVTQTGLNDSRIFIIPGREWTTATSATITEVPPTPPTGEDAIDVRLRQDASIAAVTGFGTTLFATDVTNDGLADVIVSHPRPASAVAGFLPGVYVFSGAKIATGAGTDLRITRAGAADHGDTWTGANGYLIGTDVYSSFGAVRAIGDFNSFTSGGQPTVDLAVGIASAATQSTPIEVDLRTNHVGGPAAMALGMFPAVDGYFENIYAAGASVGAWVDGGVDLTGDAKPDIISGGISGRVIIAR